LGTIEVQWFPLQPELEARDQWNSPTLFEWSQGSFNLSAWITGNPHTIRPLINNSSCTGEHVEIKSRDQVWVTGTQTRDPLNLGWTSSPVDHGSPIYVSGGYGISDHFQDFRAQMSSNLHKIFKNMQIRTQNLESGQR
jgi:hypothetical protein